MGRLARGEIDFVSEKLFEELGGGVFVDDGFDAGKFFHKGDEDIGQEKGRDGG